MNAISNVIKLGRIKKGMNQKELAKSLGVSQSAVSDWENGGKTPSGDALLKLIEILDLLPELFPNKVKNDTDEKDIDEIKKGIETGMRELEDIKRQIRRIEEVEQELESLRNRIRITESTIARLV